MTKNKKSPHTPLLRKTFIILVGLGIGVGHHLRENKKNFSHTIEESMIQCYFSPKGGCTQAIIDAIDQAEQEVHIYIFSFTLESITKALERAQARNVKVYIITDKTQAKGRESQIPKLGTWLDDLFIDKQKGVAHHKFIVIDRKFVILGSFNYSNSAEKYNREAIVYINDERTARAFYEEWIKQKAQKRVCLYNS